MSRRGSRSPDISAIEDRAIAQSERSARIRAEMAAEAQERSERLAVANMILTRPLDRSHSSNRAAEAERIDMRKHHFDDVERLRVNRDPCPHCGVRANKHREFGCKRWRAE